MPTSIHSLAAALVAPLLACGGARSEAPAAAVAATSASADTLRVAGPSGTLVGTLQVPAGRAPFPVILFISGSGPTDRDGNSPALGGRNDGIRQLAESLAARGIASARYDKRGIGASRAAAALDPAGEAALTIDAFADDAVAWARHLRADPRFGPLFIAGHSEGGLLAMLAAPRAGPDGLVLLATAGRPLHDVIREQLARQLPPPLMAEAGRVLDSLAAGRMVDSVPPMLRGLFRPSVQPFLVSTFRRDPQALLRELRVPTLVVQGTTDLQVSMVDAERLAAARPGVRLVRVEGMNHVLKPVAGDLAAQLPSYREPAPPVDARLVEAVAAFVREVARP